MDKDWRCQRYGPLGWMETIVKLLAIGVALGSLSVFDSADRTLRGTRIAEIVLLGILGAALIAELVQRILDKELFALSFKGLNIVGHWILVMCTVLSKDPGAFVFTYAFLMTLGELIRICFLFLAENIEMKFMTKPILFAISGFYVVAYLAIIIIQVIIWLTEYDANN